MITRKVVVEELLLSHSPAALHALAPTINYLNLYYFVQRLSLIDVFRLLPVTRQVVELDKTNLLKCKIHSFRIRANNILHLIYGSIPCAKLPLDSQAIRAVFSAHERGFPADFGGCIANAR